MSHNRDLSAAAGQFGFHNSNIGIGSEAPRYALDVYNSNLLVSGPSAGNIILEDRSVGDSSKPFHVVSSDGGKFVINRSDRNASGTTTGSVNSLTLSNGGNLGLGGQTSPGSNIHVGDISNGYELKLSANALTFNRSSNSYIDQVHDTGSINFRMTSSHTEAMRITSDGKIGVNITSPGCQTGGIHAVHNATQGTPSFTGAEVGIFQRNFNGAQDCAISIVSGTNASSTINFGDKDDVNPGIIEYMNGSNAMRFSTNAAERLRITSDGKLGIGHAYGSQITKELTIRPVNDGGIRFVRPGDNAGSPNVHLDLTTTTSGSVFPSGEAYTVKYNTYNNDQIFTTYVGGGTGGNISFKTATQGNTPAERFRIDSSGRVTIPDQPGCKISIDSNSQGGGNQTQTGRTILPFNSTAYGYNTGNHYNLTTHTFTCPLNGKYLVILSVNIIGDNIAYIYKNGSIHSAGEFRSNPTNVWEHMEVSTVVDCSANDTIQPYSQLISGKKFNGGSGGSYWDTFTIYFLG